MGNAMDSKTGKGHTFLSSRQRNGNRRPCSGPASWDAFQLRKQTAGGHRKRTFAWSPAYILERAGKEKEQPRLAGQEDSAGDRLWHYQRSPREIGTEGGNLALGHNHRVSTPADMQTDDPPRRQNMLASCNSSPLASRPLRQAFLSYSWVIPFLGRLSFQRRPKPSHSSSGRLCVTSTNQPNLLAHLHRSLRRIGGARPHHS